MKLKQKKVEPISEIKFILIHPLLFRGMSFCFMVDRPSPPQQRGLSLHKFCFTEPLDPTAVRCKGAIFATLSPISASIP
jgi:hypothetical protein